MSATSKGKNMKNAVLGSFTPGLPSHHGSTCRYLKRGEGDEMYAIFTSFGRPGIVLDRKGFKRVLKAAGYQFWVDDNSIIIVQKRKPR